MADEPPIATTPHHGEDGDWFLLVLRAKESRNWAPLVAWMANHPERAEEVARGLGLENDIEAVFRQPAPQPSPGTVFGGLELLKPIGEGASGVVHLAFDPVLKRDVAVKLLRAGRTLSETELAHFRYEATVAASMDHPNIVRVYASGESDGQPYLVMQLMEGGSLAKRLKDLGPDRCRSAREAAELVRDIALGVHHAHQSGLIHRDLKPGNILLDKDGRPHVADFGLARPADATASRAAGTPAYMAPEQARGDKHLTTAADVHALGAILFELLAGVSPFGAENIQNVIRRVIEEPAPLVGKFRKDVHPDLEAICAKCLEKLPKDRYSSAQALADDLTKFLNGEPIDTIRRGWFTDVFRVFAGRRETASMQSWWVGFVGAASTFAALVVIQLAILFDAPTWVAEVALAYYLVAWVVIVWWVQASARGATNQTERTSAAIQFGMMLACTALVPTQLWLRDQRVEMVFQPFLAVIGLGIFVHGATYWGRLYIAGLLYIAFAACMPLIPLRYWPGAYGLALTAFQVWIGFHLWRVHHEAETATRRTVIETPAATS